MLYTTLVILLVLVSLALIGMVLLQQGKGADTGASFGGGASGTVFGARGSSTFLSRTTAILATIFFILATTLAYLANHEAKESKTGGSVVERLGKKDDAKPADKKPAEPILSIPAPNASAPKVTIVPPVPSVTSSSNVTVTPAGAAPKVEVKVAEPAKPDVKPEAAKPADAPKPAAP